MMYENIPILIFIICIVTLMYCKKEIMKYKNPSIVQQEYWRRNKEMKIVKDVSYKSINVTQLKEILLDLENKGFGDEKVYTWQGGMFGWRTVNERYRAYKEEVEQKDGVYFE